MNFHERKGDDHVSELFTARDTYFGGDAFVAGRGAELDPGWYTLL